MSNDVWAQAAQRTQPQAGQAESQLADAYVPEPEAESQLFSGGSSFPSLFNKTHPLGSERTGIITKVTDVHSQTYGTDAASRKLKYWQEGEKSPVTNAVNPATGKQNRPVLDTHLQLDTEYRLTEAEAAAIGRRPEFVQQDDGKRVFAAGGFDLKTLREAIQRDAPALGIHKTADLIGKRITIKRAGQHPNPGGNPSWVLEIKLSNP